jgi:phosphoribosylformylglycinamidine synthase
MMDLDANLKKYRLNRSEYDRIESLLGRPPKGLEWALFSALWSEHCSYKSSKVHLKGLFNKSERVLQSFGENAGVLDLGQGERIAFKMESHNHPSFIEPYQGAATGVGGILRDIFTMGARPVMLANYLCFGRPQAPRMQSLVDGVVRGIAGYGNCVGVPNVSGQTEFHETYDNNILVNAFALGLFRKDEPIALSQAKGVGNKIVYVGAKTGRDGVHGASMASESFGKDSAAKRPTVQIGDPFFEKLLIESCLEVIQQNLVVAIQDMGAAGLTSSSFEMAAKGDIGFDIDLSKVPLRDSTLTPEDILLSESQERMLLICEPDKFDSIRKIFDHWNLDSQIIGDVVSKQTVTLRWKGEVLTEIDPRLIVDHAPIYNRDFQKYRPENQVTCDGDIHVPEKNVAEFVYDALTSVQGCSREWIYRQYDQRVGAKTASGCESSIGVIRLPDSGRGLAVVLGCRPSIMRADASVGGADAVAYPALELAAKGFEVLGVTDCLNFGNPEKLPIMSSFVASLRSMSEQCQALKAPIISGNVSFYNETQGQNITPTPATGLVGLRPSVHDLARDYFVNEDEAVTLVSLPFVWTGGESSQVTGEIHPQLMAKFVEQTRNMVLKLRPSSTRVVGKFGLGYALSKMCLNGIGFLESPDLLGKAFSSKRELYIERLYEVIIVGPSAKEIAGEYELTHPGFRVLPLGRTGGSALVLGKEKLDVLTMVNDYKSAWGKHFEELA